MCLPSASPLWCPKLFTAIAFDAGGVASGPMTATFLLPLAQGACAAVGGNIVTDAFGVVAMVAMTPLITVQLMGLVAQLQAPARPARLQPAGHGCGSLCRSGRTMTSLNCKEGAL